MKWPRPRFSMRTLLVVPAAVVLVLAAIDRMTASPDHWRLGTYEFDVVDARDRRPIQARVTLKYEGPLAGQPDSGSWYTTLGEPYTTYRGMTPEIGYGGLPGIVRHRPETLIFRRHSLTITEWVRFRVEAGGYEPFEFAPVDRMGRPLSFETWDPPVFRVELRRKSEPGMPASWSTRPELKVMELPFPQAVSATPR